MMKLLKRLSFMVPLALLLAACGGGSGTSTPVPTATPVPTISDRVQQICREQVQTNFGNWVVNTQSLEANKSDPALLTPEHREKIRQALETFERLRGQALCTLDLTPLEQAGVTDPVITDGLEYVRREVEELRQQGLHVVRTVNFIPQYTAVRVGFAPKTDAAISNYNLVERLRYLDSQGNEVRSEERSYRWWGWSLKLQSDGAWRVSGMGEVKLQQGSQS